MPMYMRNELMFPPYAIPTLRDLRGSEWRQLIEQVGSVPENHEDALAFSLMMIRLNGCLSCETDGYRAMRGCVVCATQTIRRFKGSDKELTRVYKDARKEVQAFMHQQAGTPRSPGDNKKPKAEKQAA